MFAWTTWGRVLSCRDMTSTTGRSLMYDITNGQRTSCGSVDSFAQWTSIKCYEEQYRIILISCYHIAILSEAYFSRWHRGNVTTAFVRNFTFSFKPWYSVSLHIFNDYYCESNLPFSLQTVHATSPTIKNISLDEFSFFCSQHCSRVQFLVWVYFTSLSS